MIKITRPELLEIDQNYLRRKTEEITFSRTRTETAKAGWKNKSRDRFASIRAQLEEAAAGREYCMYCLDSQGTAIDHYRPWSDEPLVTFAWENYVLACSHCNSNEKRDQFPVDEEGNAQLLNPFDDDLGRHLGLDIVLGERTARSRRGMITVEVFNLNRQHLTQGRIDAWVGLESLIVAYGKYMDTSQVRKAEATLETIRRVTFLEVLEEMRRLAASPHAPLPDEIASILQRYPYI